MSAREGETESDEEISDSTNSVEIHELSRTDRQLRAAGKIPNYGSSASESPPKTKSLVKRNIIVEEEEEFEFDVDEPKTPKPNLVQLVRQFKNQIIVKKPGRNSINIRAVLGENYFKQQQLGTSPGVDAALVFYDRDVDDMFHYANRLKTYMNVDRKWEKVKSKTNTPIDNYKKQGLTVLKSLRHHVLSGKDAYDEDRMGMLRHFGRNYDSDFDSPPRSDDQLRADGKIPPKKEKKPKKERKAAGASSSSEPKARKPRERRPITEQREKKLACVEKCLDQL